MIESFRKYTGLMIVVLVLLFVGLVFLGDGIGNSFGAKPVMTVDSRAISLKEYQRNLALMELPRNLPNSHFLPRESLILASKYLGEGIVQEPMVSSAAVVARMTQFLQPSNEAPQRFITNRLNVQKAGLEFGVTPDLNEIENFVKNVLFADPEGNYDAESYADFIKNRVSRIGGTRGFNDYLRDLLTAQNLANLLGGGLEPEIETTRLIHALNKQQISGQQVILERATYEGRVDPSEDDLKKHFEENSMNYRSDELRRVSYIHIAPDWDKTLADATQARAKAEAEAEEIRKQQEAARAKAEEEAAKANQDAPADQPDDETLPPTEDESTGQPAEDETLPPAKEESTGEPTEDTAEEAPVGEQGDEGEQGQQAPEKTTSPEETTEVPEITTSDEAPVADEPVLVTPNPTVTPAEESEPIAPKTAEEQLSATEKNEAINELIPEVNQFFQTLADRINREPLDKVAAEFQYEVKKTELFSKTSPPEALNKFIQDRNLGNLGNAVFELPAVGDPDEKLSNPFRTDSGWFILFLEETVDSIPLSFEDARTQVSIDLKQKLAREKMIEEAKSLHEKFSAGIKQGETFAKLAEDAELGYTKVEQVKESGSFRGQRFPNPPAFDAARFTNPGEIAPPHFTPSEEDADRALLIYVDSREVIKDDAYLTELEDNSRGLSQIYRLITFENWLNDRYLERKVSEPTAQP